MEGGIHPRWAPHQAHLGLLALQVSSQATTIIREVHTKAETQVMDDSEILPLEGNMASPLTLKIQ